MSYTHGKKSQIISEAKALQSEIEPWINRCDFIFKKRVWPVCLTNVVALALLPSEKRPPVSKAGLLVFAVDDIFDNKTFEIEALQRYTKMFLDAVQGNSIEYTYNEPVFTLCRAMEEVVQALAKSKIYSTTQDLWVDGWKKLIDAMFQEYDWIHGISKKPPSYATYLDVSNYSTGFFPFVRAAWIESEDNSLLDHFDELLLLEKEAGILVRLSNDVQSYQKEVIEGKYNSLSFLRSDFIKQGMDPETALKKAKVAIIDEVEQRLLACENLCNKIQTKTQLPEKLVYSSARVGFDFYKNNDFHTFQTL